MRLLPVITFCLAAGSLLAAEQNVPGRNPLDDAKRELEAGHLDAARAVLARINAEGKPDARALDLRGVTFLEENKLEEAVAAFRAAHDLDPAIYTPQLHLGDALLRQRKWEEARSAYEELLKTTNVLTLNERLRYAILLTYLGPKDDAEAKGARERVVFPTETPAYYYAQAAWSFAHGDSKGGAKWIQTGNKIFDDKSTAWFARPLYDFGWVKTRPPVVVD
jgi:tetratricopeptide (TPR) repeat protein